MAVANNQLVTAGSGRVSFSAALSSNGMQNMIRAALGTQEAMTKFCTDIMAAVGATPALKACDPTSIVTAGLQCASLKLSTSPALGEAWIVPYKDKATFQIGKNGLVQLAIRSGQYADIDTIEVRQGEYKGRDKLTGKPVFEFVEDDERRETLPIVGYLAYFELLNGFKKTVYFGKDKVLKWAARYSQAFNEELYRKYEIYEQTGEGMSAQEIQKCSSPWYSRFSTMAEKTVLRQLLLKWGAKSIDMATALNADVDDSISVDVEAIVSTPETPAEAHATPAHVSGTAVPAKPVRKAQEAANSAPVDAEDVFFN